MFAIHLIAVLAALYVGARYGGTALGVISGITLAVLVLGFGLTPGTPPTSVLFIIIAAISCASVLEAAGGMDWMIQLAEKLLRNNPRHLVFLAPICSIPAQSQFHDAGLGQRNGGLSHRYLLSTLILK